MFPGVAEAADGFAEADGEVDHGLEAVRIHGGEALAVSEKQLGVAEDSGERIIDFVAEDRGEVGRQFRPRRAGNGFRFVRPA